MLYVSALYYNSIGVCVCLCYSQMMWGIWDTQGSDRKNATNKDIHMLTNLDIHMLTSEDIHMLINGPLLL